MTDGNEPVFRKGVFQEILATATNTDNFNFGGYLPPLLPEYDKILEKASRLTGLTEKTALVRLGLEALIARESSKRLARLGGTEKELKTIPRRRSAKI